MSFLYAWALGAAALVALPLVLHLRRREPRRRISFPALRYLSRAEDVRARSLRASDLLLLALRVGLILALALAAAGPLIGHGGARDHPPTDVALVIDNSASVSVPAGGRTYLEELLERARATLALAGSRDRFWVLPAVGPPLATGVTAERAGSALDRLEQTHGRGRLYAAIARASAALPRIEDREREIHLLGDLQRSAFEPEDRPDGPDRGPGLIVLMPPDLPSTNGAVVSVRPTAGTSVPAGVSHSAVVRVERHGPGDPSTGGGDSTTARLEVDGRTVGATILEWGGTTGLRLPDATVGSHYGKIEIDPSGLRADDARYLAYGVVPPPSARRSGRRESFVELALETLRQAGRLGTGPARIEILEGAAATPGADVETVVLIPPVDPIELPRFNQLLRRVGAPWTLGRDAAAGALRLESESVVVPGLSGVNISRRYRIRSEGAAGDTALLRTEDGEPWVVRAETSGRIYLLLASPVDPEATDLPASAGMIPLLEALLLRWSAGGAWPPDEFAAGEPLSLPAWADAVRRPDGVRAPVEGGALFTPLLAGIYELSRAGAVDAGSAHFAVNVPAAESDLGRLTPDAFRELFPGRDVVFGGPAAPDWERVVYRERRGSDAGPWLVFVALALAAFEVVLATPGRAGTSG